jgi:hypothetical protein
MAQDGTTNPDAQQFWARVSKWPEDVQKSFWDSGARLSAFVGESPSPRRLQFDTSKPAPGSAWWEKAFFYLGQSSINQAVIYQAQGDAIVASASWIGGMLQGDFNKSPTTSQIVVGGILSMIPVVDQICDVRDVVSNICDLSLESERAKPERWMALGLTCVGFVPEFGSAVKTVVKTADKTGVRLIDIVKVMEWVDRHVKVRRPWGQAHIAWLERADWVGIAKQAGQTAKSAFKNALEKVQSAIKYSAGVVQVRLKQLEETLALIIKRVESAVADAVNVVTAKIRTLLRKEKPQIGKYDATPGPKPNAHKQSESAPPAAPPPPDKGKPNPCKLLVQDIYIRTTEVLKRFRDMYEDKLNLFGLTRLPDGTGKPHPSLPKGSGSWPGHEQQLSQKQKGLRDTILMYDRAKCKEPRFPKAIRDLSYHPIPKRPRGPNQPEGYPFSALN